jgi:hypothetical protein
MLIDAAASLPLTIAISCKPTALSRYYLTFEVRLNDKIVKDSNQWMNRQPNS